MKIIDPETRSVLVFKGGVVVVEKSFVLSTDYREVYLEKPSYALKGSFWINTAVPDIIKQMEIVEYEETLPKEEMKCRSLRDQLEGLVGKENVVTLLFSTKQEEVLKGQITRYEPPTVTIFDIERKMFVMRKLSDIYAIQSEEPLPLNYEREKKLTRERIKITYNCDENVPATVGYWRKEMSFIPSYRLQISNDLEGKLGLFSMQATLINEGQGLNNIEQITLAGGNPSISYPDFPDRFLSSQIPGIGGRINAMSNPVLRGNFDNRNVIVRRDLSDCSDSSDDEEDFGIEEPHMQTGPKKEDIGVSDTCFYLKNNVSSPEKSRVLIPIFTSEVPISEAYVCTLKESDQPLEVQHMFRVKNTTDFPWTASTVVVSSGQRKIFSQGKLNYTPRGRTTEIETMKSLAVKIYYKENIVKTTKVEERKYHIFHEVKMKGTVDLVNRELRKEFAIICLKFNVDGKLLKSDMKDFLKKDEKLRKGVGTNDKNLTNTRLQWTLKLKKGEKLKLTFLYSKIVRNSK